MKMRWWLVAMGVLLMPQAQAEESHGALLKKGEKIFHEVCVRCHTAEVEGKLGPGLKGIGQRRDDAWLDAWIKSPKALIDSGDSYARQLREENRYDLTMPTLPLMQKDENRKAVIAYLKTL